MNANESSDRSGVSPPELSRWQKIRLVIKVVELRLRFVALMAITGLAFAYWDELRNRYEKWTRPAHAHQTVVSGVEYYCPMHPQIVQQQPGACPICGMPLARRKKGQKEALPEGVTNRVRLTESRVEQAGVRTAEVAFAPLVETLSTVGYVAFDERLVANIVSKAPGKSRVEKLYVNFTGEDVVEGQPLAELYSPEISQAIQELFTARQFAAPAGAGDLNRSLEKEGRSLAAASVEKLKHWGVSQDQIDEILRKGKPEFNLTILSPLSGHVFKKNVVQGQEVGESTVMFEVVDLHSVWIQAQVYEHQLGLVHEGQAIEATVESFPGERFSGKVEFIQPHLDPTTRSVEVRFALPNPGHRLRPGMYATVTLRTPVADLSAFQAKRAASHPAVVRLGLSKAEQKTCPVTKAKLGSMGEPIQVEVSGGKVWTCCAACPPKLKAHPAKYLSQPAAAPPGQVLSVPESAVIDSGPRKIVYVETEPGVFDGREVVLGPRIGDRYPVLEGLAEGDKVAAAGAILIDAESRLNPAAPPSALKAAPAAKHQHGG